MGKHNSDYQQGKIYLLKHKEDLSLVYVTVGHTTLTLEERLYYHKKASLVDVCKNRKLYKAVDDWDDWEITLFENYPCSSFNELEKREYEIIQQVGTLNSVNGRSKNREYVKQIQEEYRERNRDKIRERNREYWHKNKIK